MRGADELVEVLFDARPNNIDLFSFALLLQQIVGLIGSLNAN